MIKNMEKEFDEIYYNEIGMCGCGNPEDLKKFLFKLLEIQSKKSDLPYQIRKKLQEEAFNECGLNTVLEFIFHVFDKHSIMEHGGYVGNGWVTDYGKYFMKLLYFDLTGADIFSPQELIDMGYTDSDGNLIKFDF